jgi:hypothetical protein
LIADLKQRIKISTTANDSNKGASEAGHETRTGTSKPASRSSLQHHEEPDAEHKVGLDIFHIIELVLTSTKNAFRYQYPFNHRSSYLSFAGSLLLLLKNYRKSIGWTSGSLNIRNSLQSMAA